MAIRYGRGDVKQTTTGFRGPLMVQSLTSAKSKFLSLSLTSAKSKFLSLVGFSRPRDCAIGGELVRRSASRLEGNNIYQRIGRKLG